MATTATRIVLDPKGVDHPGSSQRKRKPLTRPHKAKLVKALNVGAHRPARKTGRIRAAPRHCSGSYR